ncbi:MAG: PhzF family phenazine biosynthesis protein [Acidobacteria bacterium]|nr:PhzF family phenazine biosynthesis protein [Acidobacteriota bacterium]
MEIPVFQIDAFTSEPFKGNPAAVCLLEEPGETKWMQKVAMEMNLAETAFVVPRADGGFDLRWFTPTIEMPLCGHATLASAHALWETGRLAASEKARFLTLSGWLTAIKAGEEIEMDFPAIFSETAELPELVGDALGLESGDVKCNRVRDKLDSNFLLELGNEDLIRKLQPNFDLLRRFTNAGVIITAPGSSSKYDFVSRYFACYAGIDEDPVTGSAHCMLTPYWSAKLGKTEMVAYQASARGGQVKVRMMGDRVALGGSAATVLRGYLLC